MSPLDPKLFPLHCVVVFVFGSMFGSFFNVVIWRVPRRYSIVFPGSHCPTCGTPIRWFDNIPILSLFLLGRRCRACGVAISMRYAAVEFLTAVLFLLVFWRFRMTGAAAVYLVFVSLCLIATFTDIDHWIIPDSTTFGGLAFALAAAVVGPHLGPGHLPTTEWPHWEDAWWRGLVNAGIGAAAGWGILQAIAVGGRLLFRKEAMGGGDITLLAMFGAFLGWQGVAATLILACFLGAGIGGALLIADWLRERRQGGPLPPVPTDLPAGADPSTPEGFRLAVAHLDLHRKERSLSTHLPFGPYLCAAGVLVLLLWPQVKALLLTLYGGPWLYQ